MTAQFKRILIIADIEGSSGCWSYKGSSFMTKDWARACVGMSRDVNAVVQALLDSGVEYILSTNPSENGSLMRRAGDPACNRQQSKPLGITKQPSMTPQARCAQ
jgi:hypothetical protein